MPERPIGAIRSPQKAIMAVNIKTAIAAELDLLEGLAGHGSEIARYRDERGGFSDLRQLDEVPGLSGKVTDETRAELTL
jgi:competence protein ComEA